MDKVRHWILRSLISMIVKESGFFNMGLPPDKWKNVFPRSERFGYVDPKC